MSTPPYAKGQRSNGLANVSVSLQHINELSSGSSSTSDEQHLRVRDLSLQRKGQTQGQKLQQPILGMTTTSSTTEDRRFESSNTLSEYLQTNELYDSLQGNEEISQILEGVICN